MDIHNDVTLAGRPVCEGYECDPDKATTCEKKNCKKLGRGRCKHTTKEEWAKDDNKHKSSRS